MFWRIEVSLFSRQKRKKMMVGRKGEVRVSEFGEGDLREGGREIDRDELCVYVGFFYCRESLRLMWSCVH